VRSHPIRGVKGKDATDRDMEQNCQRAIVAGKILELSIPDLEVYIPGEHDEFVTLAYRQGTLTVDDILTTDCEIVSKRDLLLVYNFENQLSSGMRREIDYAINNDIRVFYFTSIDEIICKQLAELVDDLKLQKMQMKEYFD